MAVVMAMMQQWDEGKAIAKLEPACTLLPWTVTVHQRHSLCIIVLKDPSAVTVESLGMHHPEWQTSASLPLCTSSHGTVTWMVGIALIHWIFVCNFR